MTAIGLEVEVDEVEPGPCSWQLETSTEIEKITQKVANFREFIEYLNG